ncbi:sigma 54-interacting transcriptional regulator [Cupriavidus necator]|uniref:sigma 54-interacting transcriptional regulator n=1 Tax=Cupriavidus necator TaxID=106590 RepID=UPI00339D56F0
MTAAGIGGPMAPGQSVALAAWLCFVGEVGAEIRQGLPAMLARAGIVLHGMPSPPSGFGLMVFGASDSTVLDHLRSASRNATVLAIATAAEVGATCAAPMLWDILHSGAADVLVWPCMPADASQVSARLARWQAVQALADSPRVRDLLVGNSPVWRALVRQVVEVATFTDASVLIHGESGTGKELIARLIHELSPHARGTEMVVVDCTTISAELSGSEFFGHERGAFTGAALARDGAFALAHGGTLFLDEIGELPAPLQAQMLRVIQEHKYKRVGSNIWQHTDFRLVCATNRDLDAGMANGSFRSDLYYRIAGWTCRTPPLRERRADILPLAEHFLARAQARREPGSAPPGLDPAVREYLLARAYPGNVRDLRRVAERLLHRHAGPGPITVGDVPADEWPAAGSVRVDWRDAGFGGAIRHALELGVGLREIGQAATDAAVQIAIDLEGQNLHRAACRLGVTDRALQLRRASREALR